MLNTWRVFLCLGLHWVGVFTNWAQFAMPMRFVLPVYIRIYNTFLPMSPKKRKMQRMNKFLVGWGKDDRERERRVEAAIKIAHPVRVELVRALLDEWAKIVLARDRSDIEVSAQSVASCMEVNTLSQPARVATDSRGLVLSVNEAFTEMCGYAIDELRGKKPGSLLQGPATERPVVTAFRKAIRERKPFRGELTNYHKDGSLYRVRIEMRPVFDGSKLTGFEADEFKLS